MFKLNNLITIDLVQNLEVARQEKTDDQILHEINLDTLDIITLAEFNNVFDSLVDSLANEFINKLTTLVVQQLVRQERYFVYVSRTNYCQIYMYQKN